MDARPPAILASDRGSTIATILRAAWSVFMLSLRRLVRSKVLFSALPIPVLSVGIVLLALLDKSEMRTLDARLAFLNGPLIRMVYLYFFVFFGAWGFGFATVRQEMDDQTLHYLFLQPIPRWVLIVGKAAASLCIVWVACAVALWASYLTLALPIEGGRGTVANLVSKGQLAILLKEMGVIALGLMAYGSLGMLTGSLFKTGAPALLLLGWEWGLPYLPSTLKHWTVMHYLQSLLPVAPPEGNRVFEILAADAQPGLCFLFVGGVALISLFFCAVLMQNRECLYKES
ncbi:ABC transporter permease [Candidatus Sumerlaeota bacterium]|nr:ABC transporter permease [Candidatus Sumerlaeota bacterium]